MNPFNEFLKTNSDYLKYERETIIYILIQLSLLKGSNTRFFVNK